MKPQLNVARILGSGLVAGCVIILFDFAARFALRERFERDVEAWMPGATAAMQVSGGAVAAAVAMKLAIGVLLVWLYAAAARPTALIALPVWLLGAIFLSDFPMTGMISWPTFFLLEACQLIAFAAASWVGARLYDRREVRSGAVAPLEPVSA